MIWFCSDTHFNHASIIKHANRSFANVDEMNEGLIANWNARVKPEDDVYHLGDFAFGGKARVLLSLSRLNGRKHLIRGNHDDSVLKSPLVEHFDWVKDIYYLKVQDVEALDGKSQVIVLCHYPLASWQNMHHGSWMLHGHSHGNLKVDIGLRRYDVGVDPNNMKPISYEEVKAVMKNRHFVPVDHHGVAR